MRPSKHESVRPKPVKNLRLVRSVFATSEGRRLYFLDVGAWRIRCSIGRGGLTRAKREGDGKTPAGRFAILGWRFRPLMKVRSHPLDPLRMIRADDGWCDDPTSGAYNRPIKLPFRFRHEKLWRDDDKYDAVAILNYNINPRKLGKGSAIFFHICSVKYETTAGCVAITSNDMYRVIQSLSRRATIDVN